MAIAMHYHLRLLDFSPVVTGFNYKAHLPLLRTHSVQECQIWAKSANSQHGWVIDDSTNSRGRFGGNVVSSFLRVGGATETKYEEFIVQSSALRTYFIHLRHFASFREKSASPPDCGQKWKHLWPAVKTGEKVSECPCHYFKFSLRPTFKVLVYFWCGALQRIADFQFGRCHHLAFDSNLKWILTILLFQRTPNTPKYQILARFRNPLLIYWWFNSNFRLFFG